MTEPSPVLVLIGPPGAGKSVLGKLTAKSLGVPFVDTDRRIEAKHGPIAKIFAQHGEEWFRAVERVEVAEALHERAVLALGGGAVLSPQTQADLDGVRIVLVTVSLEAVARRIRGSARPLLRDGLESWQRLADERRETYERLASRTIDTSQRSAGSLARELAEWVQKEDQQ